MPEEKKFYTKYLTFFIVFFTSVYIAQSLSGILMPFFLGFVGAYILNTPTKTLERLKIPRSIASLIVMSLFFSLLVLIFFVALPYIQNEILNLAKSFPSSILVWIKALKLNIDKVCDSFGIQHINISYDKIVDNIGDFVGIFLQFLINLLSNGGKLAGILSMTVITPIIMFYWLKDFQNFNEFISNKLGYRFKNITQELNEAVTLYLKGQFIVCFCLMIIYPTFLYIIGFKKFALVGIMSAIFSFVPYLGVVTAFILGFSININLALTNSIESIPFLNLTICLSVIAFIEAYILCPRFIGSKIRVHPLFILFSLMAAGTWFGIVGIIFAMPVAAMARVLIERVAKL